MAKSKARRTRTAHPGVYIKKRVLPSGETSHRARYFDPDGNKLVYKTLDASLTTPEQRRAWAIEQSRQLTKRRLELDAGDSARTRTPVVAAVADYFRVMASELADTTLERRQVGVGRFEAWCTTRGVQIVESITSAQLMDLRAWIVTGGRFAVVKGGKRGARSASSKLRSPATINTDLTAVKILLNHLRKQGKVPKLSRDIITDQLKHVDAERDDPEYLSSAQIRELLSAARRHDAATFKATRAEHKSKAVGSTLKYADTPIAPFVEFLLFSGCRRGEALGLEWTDVDLDALDQHEKAVGEIKLRGAQTKTKRGRSIGLDVSPRLRTLLVEMRKASGGVGRVFEGYSVEIVDRARERMVGEYGAPVFTWHLLRATCATYLTCSRGIWGSATVFLSARQLGHSVAIADKHYLGVNRGVPRDARTLEDAMRIPPQI